MPTLDFDIWVSNRCNFNKSSLFENLSKNLFSIKNGSVLQKNVILFNAT